MNCYFLDPFGCVKNQVDAENMMAHLNNAGWKCINDAEYADLIIVNSCGFIESAKQESINAVMNWRKLYPGKKILLAGCLSQRYAKELPDLLPEADGFFGVENISQITDAASDTVNAGSNAKKHKNTGIKASAGNRPLLSLPGSAYVKISEGCNNRCSYCAIPLIRGNLVCRTIPDILNECKILLSRGIRELNIIGQDIAAFGTCNLPDKTMSLNTENINPAVFVSKLPELLNAISLLEGHFWVRLLYLHPDHFPLEILDIIKQDKRFLPYFDIPFQHASPAILKAMNRNGNGKVYLELINAIRKKLPDAVIRSAFLLGFPGETDDDFAALLDFQKKAKLDWLGCFTFSREEGTAAYSLKNRVPAKTALARKKKIEENQIPITEKNMECFTGLSMDVLIEEKIDPVAAANGEYSEPIWLGRLYCQAPDIDGAAVITGSGSYINNLQPGTFFKCKVIARRGFDLEVRV